jgi:hypothetical protein
VIFNWSGFFAPLNNSTGMNKRNAGAALPVKFSLSRDAGLNIFLPGFPMVQQVNCNTLALLGSPESTASTNPLQYNQKSNQYTYNWKTQKTWAGTCRVLSVKLIDGTAHTAYIQFTK